MKIFHLQMKIFNFQMKIHLIIETDLICKVLIFIKNFLRHRHWNLTDSCRCIWKLGIQEKANVSSINNSSLQKFPLGFSRWQHSDSCNCCQKCWDDFCNKQSDSCGGKQNTWIFFSIYNLETTRRKQNWRLQRSGEHIRSKCCAAGKQIKLECFK